MTQTRYATDRRNSGPTQPARRKPALRMILALFHFVQVATLPDVERQSWGETMKLFAGLLAALAVAMLITTPADARKKDKANSGYCKSGTQVGDMAKCKENGGAK